VSSTVRVRLKSPDVTFRGSTELDSTALFIHKFLSESSVGEALLPPHHELRPGPGDQPKIGFGFGYGAETGHIFGFV